MNETLLWLLYVLSGVAACCAIYFLRWRIVPAMLGGALVTAAGWYVLYLLTGEDDRPQWITLDLSLNVCFGLIFAGAGAAIGYALRSSRD